MSEYPSLETATSGSIRFNTDSSKLEIYNGEQWFEIDTTSPNERTGGTRCVMAGGKLTHPNRQNIIQFVNMDTTGNAADFGDLVMVQVLVSLLHHQEQEEYLLDLIQILTKREQIPLNL